MPHYSIKQISKLSGLPASTLRYYEAMWVIWVISRDQSSKHRTYSDDDLRLIQWIACMNASGMPLKDIQEYMKNLSENNDLPYKQRELLENQRNRIQSEMKNLENQRKYIESKIEFWKAIELGDEENINIKRAETYIFAEKLRGL